jgi:hypothetical protein
MHTRTAAELAQLYPRWQDFRRVRAQLDPQGMFLNDYLRGLFDADAPIEAALESSASPTEQEESQTGRA